MRRSIVAVPPKVMVTSSACSAMASPVPRGARRPPAHAYEIGDPADGVPANR
jgi:hypothetical protein